MRDEVEKETIDWQNLSKKQKRQLKKEQKRLKKEKEAKKAFILKYTLILGFIILSIVGFFLFRFFKTNQYEKAPKIQIEPATYNFGEVPASEGRVEASLEIKNTGASPLVISGMQTSCGCTTARLKIGEKESPIFGMHNNPTDWSASIDPKTSAELVVIFDPNFHETAGPMTRTISVFSNDPRKKEEKITIYVDVNR